MALYCRERPMCRSVPIESKIGRGKKTLEGESPLLKDGALSLQTSLSLRELPPCPRRLRSEILFRFWRVAGSWGKFLVFWEVRFFLQSAASHPIGGWDAFRRYSLHECRDSACRRPFGVRRNAVGVCSEMTQCVERFVRYNRFVAMLLLIGNITSGLIAMLL